MLRLAPVVAALFFAATAVTYTAGAFAQDLAPEDVKAAIERAVAFLKKEQNQNGSWSDNSIYPGGVTALCTLALLNAGVPIDDPVMERAMKYLRALESDKVYVISLQTMVFCAAEPAKDAQLIARNVRLLENRQIKDGLTKGSWSYSAPTAAAGDNSNTQFALLALHEAERAGIAVDGRTWRLAQAYWESCQNSDFSWGYQKRGQGEYPGTGSMTCAGIASLIIAGGRTSQGDATVNGDTIECCGKKKDNEPIEKALAWLGRNFTVHDNPATADQFGRGWLLYYLYGVERIGRLTGQRFLVNPRGEKHDWYREGTEMFVRRQDKTTGVWRGLNHFEQEPKIGTSLALLFLSKGRRPVLVGKLQHGAADDWNNHRGDVANLTTYVETKWKKDFPIGLSWQVVDLGRATAEDLLQAPVLFINGSERPQINDAQAKLLREYLDRGGFIFAEATCATANAPGSRDDRPNSFDTGFRELMQKVFEDRPEHELKLLDQSHPVWYADEPVAPDQQRPLYGIDYGCRTCVVYAPPPRPTEDPAGNLSCYWEVAGGREQKYSPKIKAEVAGAHAIGINVLAYATNRELKSKEENFNIPTNEIARNTNDRSVMYIAKLRHPGGCDAAPGALPGLLRAVKRELTVPVEAPPEPIDITSPALFNHHLAFMHGRTGFRFTPAEREQLKLFLSEERGGTLLADAICANRAFADSFRREMQEIFPESKLEPIPADHEMFTAKFGGYDLSNVARRDPQARAEGGRAEAKLRHGPPELEGIKVKIAENEWRYAVIFSKYDISCALEKHDSIECEGYTRDDAERIALNVLLYSLLK
jgi:hypothetical protein